MKMLSAEKNKTSVCKFFCILNQRIFYRKRKKAIATNSIFKIRMSLQPGVIEI